MFSINQEDGAHAVENRIRDLIQQLKSGKMSVKVGILKGSTVLVEPEELKIPKTIMRDIRKEARMRKAGRDTADIRKKLLSSIKNRKNWGRGVPKMTIRWNHRKPARSISVAQYAFWNEFGTKKIPARPFMRNTLNNERNRAGWNEIVRNGLEFGMSVSDIMHSLGHQMHLDMINTIKTASSWAVPNAPFTVARKRAKGRSHPDMPLIDDGNLIRSIWYEVIEK